MAKIPLPDRGQPLDVTYIYQMANAINQVSDEISSATYNYTTISTRDAGNQVIQTRAARIIGGYVDIATNETVTAGTTKPFTFSYSSDFKYPPIATATVVNRGTSDIGDDVTVVIRSVTTSRIEGVVKFNTAGQVTTTVNITAIGIPT
jgi:nucleoid DNA-binding protein